MGLISFASVYTSIVTHQKKAIESSVGVIEPLEAEASVTALEIVSLSSDGTCSGRDGRDLSKIMVLFGSC